MPKNKMTGKRRKSMRAGNTAALRKWNKMAWHSSLFEKGSFEVTAGNMKNTISFALTTEGWKVFISCIHLGRSQNLEGGWMNLLSIAFRWANQIVHCHFSIS